MEGALVGSGLFGQIATQPAPQSSKECAFEQPSKVSNKPLLIGVVVPYSVCITLRKFTS